MTQSLASVSTALQDRYRITGELGAGGMATVYRAHDLRHDRDVAVKVLRGELGAALGPERFLAEIRMTARLQHPHILGLIESGEAAGHLFYVMPLVHGETLRSRLRRERQLPIDDALRIARDVALALDYAHRQGVVHRDIKPENILLQDGQAMVADFGVALAISHADEGRLTSTGFSLGTPQYMSPEQAMGERDLTPRSDVYALGCVLYEMLAGEPPFTGPTAQAIVARSMISEPHEITTVRTAVPPHVGLAIRTALKKVPADRFATAQAFADALFTPVAASTPVAPRGAQRPTGVLLAAAVVLAVAGVAAGWLARGAPAGRDSAVRTSRLAFLPSDATLLDPAGRGFALSPDGATIAYLETTEVAAGAPLPQARYRIAIRPLDATEPRVLDGTEGARHLFFAPDGQSIAFLTDGALKQVSVADGAVSTVTSLREHPDLGAGSDGSWDADGYLLFGELTGSASVPAGIRRVAMPGGAVTVLTRPDTALGELEHYGAQHLPGTDTFLYTVRSVASAPSPFRLMARALDGGAPQLVLAGVRNARYIDGGWLAYQTDEDVLVAPFDVRTLKVTGAATRVVRGVYPSNRAWAIARDVIVYRPALQSARTLVWVSRSGTREPLVAPAAAYTNPAISPDGSRVALAIRGGAGSDVAVYDLGSRVLTRLSTDERGGAPYWTRDGTRLFYTQFIEGARRIYSRASDGSGTPEQLLVVDARQEAYPMSIAPDMRTMVVLRLSVVDSIRGIWTLDMAQPDASRMRRLIDTPGAPLGGRISPDGRWFLYFADNQLFVTPYPAGTPRWQISRDGAREAVWSRDGRELFFRNGRRMYVVPIRAGTTFAWDAPRVLFEGDYYSSGGSASTHYDVAPDGSRFLMIAVPPPGPARIDVVQGWPALLARTGSASAPR